MTGLPFSAVAYKRNPTGLHYLQLYSRPACINI